MAVCCTSYTSTMLLSYPKRYWVSIICVCTGIKAVAYMMAAGIFGVYVAASMAGASMRVADLVTTFSLLTIGICIGTIGSSIGWRSLESTITSIPVVKKIDEARGSNVIKAIAVLVLGRP